jgi:hypothetical protein
MKRSSASLAMLLVLLASIAVSGQNGVHNVGGYFLRGKVMAIQPDQVTIAPHHGGPAETVPLRTGWTVGVITPVDDSVLTVGLVVNIVEVDWKDEIPRALYVDTFPRRAPTPPPSSGGTAGVVTKGRNWAQMPGRDEFGAWGALGKVLSVQKTADGILVVTELSEGPHTSLVPPGTPIVRNEPGDQSMVKAGMNAHVLLRKGPDGKPVSARILIGATGGIPPM